MNENDIGEFHMNTTAQKSDGSIGIRIPHHIAKKYGIVSGIWIQITDDGEKIVLNPVKDKPTLEELVAKCTLEGNHEEIDFKA